MKRGFSLITLPNKTDLIKLDRIIDYYHRAQQIKPISNKYLTSLNNFRLSKFFSVE